MTANNRWIPYMHLIMKRVIDLNINYGMLILELPFISQAFGYYMAIKYEFNDNTLNELLNEINLWNGEL